MADFLKAHPFIIQHEGGYVNDPDDKGGETYRGITRKNFPSWPGWETVDNYKPLNRGEIINSGILDASVNQFYKLHFWDNIKGDRIDNQSVATYIYDWYVNAGRNAIKELQRVLGITDDGLFGNGTLAAINAADDTLLAKLHEAREAYYNRIATGGNAKFLKGWLNRSGNMYEKLA